MHSSIYRNGNRVELPVVDTEPHSTILFRDEYHGACPFGRGWFDYPCPEHPVNLRFLLFPCGWSGTVRRLVNRASIGLELNAVLRGPDFSQPAGPHVLKFGQYLEDLRTYFVVLGIDMDFLLSGVGVLL